MDKEQATKNVHKALNDLFGIQPVLSVREARELVRQFQQDLILMENLIDEMEAMGVPPDYKPSRIPGNGS